MARLNRTQINALVTAGQALTQTEWRNIFLSLGLDAEDDVRDVQIANLRSDVNSLNLPNSTYVTRANGGESSGAISITVDSTAQFQTGDIIGYYTDAGYESREATVSSGTEFGVAATGGVIADNTVITLVPPAIAARGINGVFNVLDPSLGADGTAAGDTAALQGAVSAAEALYAAIYSNATHYASYVPTVYLPGRATSYKINDTITTSYPIRFIGDGETATVLEMDTAVDKPMFVLELTYSVHGNKCVFRDMTLLGSDDFATNFASLTNQNGIEHTRGTYDSPGILIQNVRFMRWGAHGILLQGGQGAIIEDCFFALCYKAGVKVYTAGVVTYWITHVSIHHCYFTNNRIGVHCQGITNANSSYTIGGANETENATGYRVLMPSVDHCVFQNNYYPTYAQAGSVHVGGRDRPAIGILFEFTTHAKATYNYFENGFQHIVLAGLNTMPFIAFNELGAIWNAVQDGGVAGDEDEEEGSIVIVHDASAVYTGYGTFTRNRCTANGKSTGTYEGEHIILIGTSHRANLFEGNTDTGTTEATITQGATKSQRNSIIKSSTLGEYDLAIPLIKQSIETGDAGNRYMYYAGLSYVREHIEASSFYYELIGRDLGNDVDGAQLRVGRNTNVAVGTVGPAAGALMLEAANGTNYYLWVDATGDLRIHTAAPTGSSGAPTVADTAGTIVGSQS